MRRDILFRIFRLVGSRRQRLVDDILRRVLRVLWDLFRRVVFIPSVVRIIWVGIENVGSVEQNLPAQQR